MNKKKEIEYSKRISSLKRVGRVSFCFHPNQEACSEKIVLSHGLQENGKLSIIEADYRGENKILSFERFKPHNKYVELVMPKPQGKSMTTTFKGFCGFHDTQLFSEIENNVYKNTYEHNFRNSYRSFAYSYHYAISENMSLENDPDSNSWHNGVHKYQLILDRGKRILNNLQSLEDELNNALTQKDYGYLKYFVYEFSSKIPIGCCGVVHPKFNFFDNKLSEAYQMSNIIFTVFPEDRKLVCIFASFPYDNTSLEFMSHLKELDDYEIQSLISSLLVNYTNSTSISPEIWRVLKLRGQKKLCLEIKRTRVDQLLNPVLKSGFNRSPINFFSKRFIN